ncbi:metabotropic glutamate receptor 4-like [Patiria miniata]|uniref:G-protein coupled receptors family 3 profile domain-containing protein n=1 Tax=Patiria miniata TaxID=46514 RepID=A0A914A9E2_PATMI|nr:metabotropic glutamate receptor 4-like [Patiria miniata]
MAMVAIVCLLMTVTVTVLCAEIPPALEMRHTSRGDFIIGGIYPFRSSGTAEPCTSVPSRWAVEMSQTMIFAIQEINSDPSLLSGCRLGYDIRDDCRSEEFTLYTTTSLATGRQPLGAVVPAVGIPVGMIGPESSVHAIYAGKVASLYQIPIISYSATSDELSNKERFPYFLRTVPPDELQARAIVDILLHHDWRYVGLLYSADTYGIHGSLEVAKLAERNNICVAFSIAIREEPEPNEIEDIVARVGSFRHATVFVVFSFNRHMYDVLRAIHVAYPGRKLVCIGSDGFSGYGFLEYPSLANVTRGSFFVRLTQNTVPNVEKYIRSLGKGDIDEKEVTPWMSEYIDEWRAHYNCSNMTLCPIPFGDTQSNVYLAVYAYAHALHNFHQSRQSNGSCFNITGQMLLPYLLNGSFESEAGHVDFDSNGNSGGRYRLNQMQLSPDGQFERVGVGFWESHRVGNGLDLTPDAVRWPLGSPQPPMSLCMERCHPGFIVVPLEQKCCWGCRECPVNAIVVNDSRCQTCRAALWPDSNRSACEAIHPTSVDLNSGASIVLLSVSACGILSCVLTAAGLYHHRGHALIKATSRELSCINILGLTAAFASVYFLLARPSAASCLMAEAAISLSFTLIYAPTLLKVNRIFRIFQSSRRSVRRPRFVGPKHQMMLAFVFILIQVFASIMSASVAPSQPTILLPPDVRKYVELYCSFGEGFTASIAYNAAIILACCFYAFKTRKVPSNYNESKFIAVSVYSTLVLFLAVIPVYTTALQVLQKVATLSAALQMNASLTLALVYLPKLYGIHFAHELNVQEWRTTTAGNQIGSVSGTVNQMKPDSASDLTKQTNECAGTSSNGGPM